MNTRILAFLAIAFGSLTSCGEVTEADFEAASDQLWNQYEGDLEAIEGLATHQEKRDALDQLLNDASGEVLALQWNHPQNQNWEIVEWPRVSELETFFADQTDWIIADEAIATEAANLAQLQFASAAIGRYFTEGDSWFGEWVKNISTSPDSNLKWLVYWSSNDFGEDLVINDEEVPPTIDWNSWETSYNNANELGKAIILKSLASLGAKLGQSEETDDIQMLAFSGNNDKLKAIAIARASSTSGASVISEWEGLAASSGNLELKSLAQKAVDKFSE